ncbi:MAG: hypothetical protein COX46_05310, partial [bacterium (Candidatus Ratteibacteria) CG23_combo_of_CG06-09_8_20_14_all_48_7]
SDTSSFPYRPGARISSGNRLSFRCIMEYGRCQPFTFTTGASLKNANIKNDTTCHSELVSESQILK